MNAQDIEDFNTQSELGVYRIRAHRAQNVLTYSVWSGGSSFGGQLSGIQVARCRIFDEIKKELRSRIDKMKDRIEKLEALEKKLGNDTFNLGKFKTDEL